ncbi:hypothetical protein ACQEUU_10715 [Nonomuraea sp. CA-218870]|uniref:hypothetical protein n=1 Tax=Nonomuraea sp. CA-218870 TaxID=3239998 RepID=UPI003D94CE14
MDDLRLLQEMRADAPEPDDRRLATMRAALGEEITVHGLTTGAPPREALAAGALATQGAVRGTAARRVPRRFVKLAAALSGVAAAAVAALMINGGASAAFAVASQADGSIKVTINELRDPGELERALAAQGVDAQVDYLPEGKTCQPSRGEPAKAEGRVESGLHANGGKVDFTITKNAVGGGETLVLAVTGSGPGETPTSLSISVIKGEVKECAPVPLPKPAGSGERVSGPEKGTEGPAADTRGTTEQRDDDGSPRLDSDGG